jgi:hypothetical protein
LWIRILTGLPIEEYRRPLASSSPHSENDGDGDDLNEILNPRTNPQVRHDADSWVPSTDALTRSLDPVEIALAPSPGPAYNTFYSPMRDLTRENDEICLKVKPITASFPGQTSSIGSLSGVIVGHIPLLVQSSGSRISSRHIPSQTQYNTTTNLEWFRGDLKFLTRRVVDFITDSLNSQVSLFHPRTQLVTSQSLANTNSPRLSRLPPLCSLYLGLIRRALHGK